MDSYQVELKVSCRNQESLKNYFNTILMMAKGFQLSIESSSCSITPSEQQEPVVIKKVIEPKKKYLSMDDVVDQYGVKKNTVYKWGSLKKIPFFKMGSRTMFDREELEQWITKTRSKVLGRSNFLYAKGFSAF